MRYTIIVTPALPFYTNILLFPDWTKTIIIIDNNVQQYVNASDWSSPDTRPDWKPILIDKI